LLALSLVQGSSCLVDQGGPVGSAVVLCSLDLVLNLVWNDLMGLSFVLCGIMGLVGLNSDVFAGIVRNIMSLIALMSYVVGHIRSRIRLDVCGFVHGDASVASLVVGLVCRRVVCHVSMSAAIGGHVSLDMRGLVERDVSSSVASSVEGSIVVGLHGNVGSSLDTSLDLATAACLMLYTSASSSSSASSASAPAWSTRAASANLHTTRHTATFSSASHSSHSTAASSSTWSSATASTLRWRESIGIRTKSILIFFFIGFIIILLF